jgi:hypothetical protein
MSRAFGPKRHAKWKTFIVSEQQGGVANRPETFQAVTAQAEEDGC